MDRLLSYIEKISFECPAYGAGIRINLSVCIPIELANEIRKLLMDKDPYRAVEVNSNELLLLIKGE